MTGNFNNALNDRGAVSGLMAISLKIIALGMVADAIYCWGAKHFFGIILPYIHAGYYFGNFRNWFSLPDVDITYYASPPEMLVLMAWWKWVYSVAGFTPAFALFVAVWIGILTYAVYKAIHPGSGFDEKKFLWSLLVVLFAYPTAFCFKCGNIAGFVTAMSILGVMYYKQEKFLKSILCIAIAANIKIIPAVFLILPFMDRRWMLVIKYAAAIVLVFGVSFVCESLLYPGYSMALFSAGMAEYYKQFIVDDNWIEDATSLLMALKIIMGYIYPTEVYTIGVGDTLVLYHALAGVLTIGLAVLLYAKRPPFLQTAIALSCWFVLVPDVIADYYLAVLLLPLALAVRERNRRYTILLSLALIPKWFYVPEIASTHTVLSPLLIFVILVLCLAEICRGTAQAASYNEEDQEPPENRWMLATRRAAACLKRLCAQSEPHPASAAAQARARLRALSLAIVGLGMVFEIVYCQAMKDIFGIELQYIHSGINFINMYQGWTFGNFRYWFNYPVIPAMPGHFLACPPGMVFIMCVWKAINAVTGLKLSLALFMALWISVLSWAIYKAVNFGFGFNARNLLWSFLILVVSYPFIFCVESGNIAGLSTAAIILGIVYYKEERFSLSALCIALAVNIKIVPLLFLLVPAIDRKWSLIPKYLAISGGMFIATLLAQQMIFDPDYSLDKFSFGMQQFYKEYVASNAWIQDSTSILQAVKIILSMIYSDEQYFSMLPTVIAVYHVACGCVTGLMIVSLYIKRPPLLQTTILLSCWFIIFPDVIADYYLGMVFLPLAIAIHEGDKLYTILLSLVLVPKWIYIPGIISTHALLSPALILMIFLRCGVEIYRMPMPRPAREDWLTALGRQWLLKFQPVRP